MVYSTTPAEISSGLGQVALWSVLEPLLGLINCCLPVLQPVVSKLSGERLWTFGRQPRVVQSLRRYSVGASQRMGGWLGWRSTRHRAADVEAANSQIRQSERQDDLWGHVKEGAIFQRERPVVSSEDSATGERKTESTATSTVLSSVREVAVESKEASSAPL